MKIIMKSVKSINPCKSLLVAGITRTKVLE